MQHAKKNLFTILISTFLSILVLYFLYFAKIHFEHHEKVTNLFKTVDKLNFHRNYSKKLHHLRDSDGRWEIKNKPENYLFSTVNEFTNNSKNILLLGDSWVEQITSNNESYEIISSFVKKNNYGLINAGVTSYSPSLMQLQYDILEKDFNIKPNVVLAYIDQTDIGDELCRYKDKRVFNNNVLIAVNNENYSRATYDYTKIYNISEIALQNKQELKRTFKLTNFFIKYAFLRFIEKVKSIKKFGFSEYEISKCRFGEIRKYLVSSNNEEIIYFENRVKDFINFLYEKKYIEKIIIVSFPHSGHIFGYQTPENERSYYSFNVSTSIDKAIRDKNKIYHLNFSELISDGKISLNVNSYIENDPGSHLNKNFHASIFTKKIIEKLK